MLLPVLERVEHRHDVLGRHLGLDVVDRRRDVSGAEVLHAARHLGPDLVRRPLRQDALRVAASAERYSNHPTAKALAQLAKDQKELMDKTAAANGGFTPAFAAEMYA